MREVALFEAKTKLGGLLDEVAAGHEITITRHGKAAARLVPVDSGFDRAKAKHAAQALLRTRKGLSLGGLSIKELVNEGRP
jgi:prevent-host-death family protein